MRFKAVLGFSLAASALATLPACSRFDRVQVFNASGDEIVLFLTPDYAWQARSATLAPNTSRTFRVAHLRNDLMARGCAYAYRAIAIPEAFRPGTNGVAKVQVQPDFSVVLLREAAKAAMPAAAAARDQPPGFPIQPVSRRCG